MAIRRGARVRSPVARRGHRRGNGRSAPADPPPPRLPRRDPHASQVARLRLPLRRRPPTPSQPRPRTPPVLERPDLEAGRLDASSQRGLRRWSSLLPLPPSTRPDLLDRGTVSGHRPPARTTRCPSLGPFRPRRPQPVDIAYSMAIMARVVRSAPLPSLGVFSGATARCPEDGNPMPVGRRSGDLSIIADHLRARGYFWERSWTYREVVRLASTLGRPFGDIGDPRLVRVLTPQPSHEVHANTLSRRHGLGPFPFHTETAYWSRPARYVVLYCVDPGAGERPTLLVDSRQWQLSTKDRRQFLNAAFRVMGRRTFLTSLAVHDGPDLWWRFDRACMSPATSDAGPAIEQISTLIGDSNSVEISWMPRDLLVFDNYRCIHARGAATRKDTDRILHRILVDS